MYSFTAPQKLNGEQLKNELAAVDITLNDKTSPAIDSEGVLWLDILDKDKTEAKKIVDNHKGIDTPNARASALAKLAALGLSADEIAAL